MSEHISGAKGYTLSSILDYITCASVSLLPLVRDRHKDIICNILSIYNKISSVFYYYYFSLLSLITYGFSVSYNTHNDAELCTDM